MAYSEPKLQIFQDFQPALSAGAAPLYACVIGPNYELHRFSEETEKAYIAPYDRAVGSVVYAWPDHVAGGDIDLDTAVIWLEGTLMRYYTGVSVVEQVTDNGNQLFSSLVFKTANGYDRESAAFGDRDVAVGDTVRLTWINPSTLLQETFETTVAGFVADTVSGTADPTTIRVSGFGDTTAGATETTVKPLRITTAYVTAAYDGLPYGYPEDTYTIRVLEQGFAGAGLLDGTKLRITSAGGDTATEVVLGTDIAWGGSYYEVPLGVRGAIMRVSDSSGGQPIANQATWVVVVSQTYTEVDVTDAAEFKATGPYTGSRNTQYIMTCVIGGTVGTDDLVFNITTNNGADIEDQITVPASDFPPAQNDYAIGSYGMELSFFSTTAWNTGDVVVFDVAGQSSGAIHTLVLRDNIPVETSVQCDMDLLIEQTIQMSSSFYTLSDDSITIFGNASYLSNLLGSTTAMSLFGGSLYADYRELKTNDCTELGTVETVTGLEDVLGPAVATNPLALGVRYALAESGGTPVYYVATCGESLSSYSDALDVLTENDEIYSLVTLSDLATVKALVATHVEERSSALNNQWRIGWVGNTEPEVAPVLVTGSGGADILATVEEYSPGLYRKVTSTGALFLTSGVEGGDELRINYSLDLSGNTIHATYMVDRVIDEDTIILTTSLPAPIVVAIKVEIWRDQTNNEYAASLAAYPARFDSRRMYCVYGDGFVDLNGGALDTYYVCCALAGQRSGMAPHAPMSQVTLSSVLMDPIVKFSRTHNNTIASGGNWIVAKDFSARVYTRHQVSTYTNPNDLNQREQSKTTNLDHISRDFYLNTQDLFGQGNISPEMINLIRQRVNSLIEKISNRPYPAKLGPQMLDAEIIRLERDSVLRDTLLVEINPDMPDPLNTLNILFTIS